MKFQIIVALLLVACAPQVQAELSVSQQIDRDVWSVVSQAAIDHDSKAMFSTYHPDAILVKADETLTIASTQARSDKGMKEALENGSSAIVEFRFSKRMDNQDSAFESGIFHYATKDADGNQTTDVYVIFDALLIKKDGRWLLLMEHQLEKTDKATWMALK